VNICGREVFNITLVLQWNKGRNFIQVSGLQWNSKKFVTMGLRVFIHCGNFSLSSCYI